jgi:hypothetical protein
MSDMRLATSSSLREKYGLFVSTRDVSEFKNVQLAVTQLIQEVVQLFSLRNQPEEFLFDDLFLHHPLNGFGAAGTQVYVKDGIAVTPLHDEIAWSSALNFLNRGSHGMACWLGVNLVKLCGENAAIKQQVHDLITDLRREGDSHGLLSLMLEHGHIPSIVFQLPHTGVLSPAGKGDAHFVLSVGERLCAEAINFSCTAQGLNDCLRFWSEKEVVKHNCGLSTLHVAPIFHLMEQGFKLDSHWTKQFEYANEVIRIASTQCDPAQRMKLDIYRRYSAGSTVKYCGTAWSIRPCDSRRAAAKKGCKSEIRWKAVEGLCISCFCQMHPLIKGGPYPLRPRDVETPAHLPLMDLDIRLYQPTSLKRSVSKATTVPASRLVGVELNPGPGSVPSSSLQPSEDIASLASLQPFDDASRPASEPAPVSWEEVLSMRAQGQWRRPPVVHLFSLLCVVCLAVCDVTARISAY